jgi:hypothetical protein
VLAGGDSYSLGYSPGQLPLGRQAAVVLYVLALVAVVVGVDVLFFRNQFWERLIANVGIVLVFAAFLFQVPEASMSAAAAIRLTQLHGSLTGPPQVSATSARRK